MKHSTAVHHNFTAHVHTTHYILVSACTRTHSLYHASAHSQHGNFPLSPWSVRTDYNTHVLISISIPLQADRQWERGNHQRARESARMARNFGIGAIALTVATIVLIVIIIPVALTTESSSSDYSDY